MKTVGNQKGHGAIHSISHLEPGKMILRAVWICMKGKCVKFKAARQEIEEESSKNFRKR